MECKLNKLAFHECEDPRTEINPKIIPFVEFFLNSSQSWKFLNEESSCVLALETSLHVLISNIYVGSFLCAWSVLCFLVFCMRVKYLFALQVQVNLVGSLDRTSSSWSLVIFSESKSDCRIQWLVQLRGGNDVIPLLRLLTWKPRKIDKSYVFFYTFFALLCVLFFH